MIIAGRKLFRAHFYFLQISEGFHQLFYFENFIKSLENNTSRWMLKVKFSESFEQFLEKFLNELKNCLKEEPLEVYYWWFYTWCKNAMKWKVKWKVKKVFFI